MRVLTVIGNRPQFVKLAGVSGLLREHHEEVVVHTGQHHDPALSEVFFRELDLPAPDHQLEIAGGTNADQIGRMLVALDDLLARESVDLVLVYGDTNSTIAGALAAAHNRVPLAHVEAGLRSFDRSMPEEINRVITDALADLLLCPSETAVANLAAEGAHGETVLTGDVMGDVVLKLVGAARDRSDALERFGLTVGDFFLLTAHRPANVDDAHHLAELVALVERLPRPVIFATHPRTRRMLSTHGLLERLESTAGVTLSEPLGYLDTLCLTAAAAAVITDSGGLQKEAAWIGTQCITLRDRTEWVETVESGRNTLVGLDADAALAALASPPEPASGEPLYNAGRAGAATIAAIDAYLASQG